MLIRQYGSVDVHDGNLMDKSLFIVFPSLHGCLFLSLVIDQILFPIVPKLFDQRDSIRLESNHRSDRRRCPEP